MIYLKTNINDDIEIRISIYDDELFTTCPDCGKEIEVDTESLRMILKNGDLSSTSMCCEECSARRVSKNTEGIETLGLTVRGYNVLKRTGISTIAELLERWADIENLRNMGRKAYNDIGEKLAEAGYIKEFDPSENYCRTTSS